MITETTKKHTIGLSKILPTLTVEQIEVLNLHCEKVEAAKQLCRIAQGDLKAYTAANNAFIAARAQRTKALKKAGFPRFCTGSCDSVIF